MANVKDIDTNLQGQKLGNKGRITRERIMTVARDLIENPSSEGFSLSAVARHTELRMSSIYNYFADPTELFLAVFEPIAEEAEEAYIGLIRDRWPDEEVETRSTQFIAAFHTYWQRHSRILHLRNRLADQHDERVMLKRISMARNVVRLLGQQAGGNAVEGTGPEYDLASVLYTGLERVVTIATDEEMKAHYPPQIKPRFEGGTLYQQARLLALAISDERGRSQKRSAA
ncbi:TetR/AcrR family transcriptional regulator [Novosphingopyxis baekryungensis]|uniref:TetR/AcrR family transcriptional regulator n=1 Tax=Novosphingopyxis baekryungensis TaxID=279369 RepID=UPI0003B45082|nr:TetR/AcrR family transcriptional regulator [Novosphingopyxis baekryungensis]